MYIQSLFDFVPFSVIAGQNPVSRWNRRIEKNGWCRALFSVDRTWCCIFAAKNSRVANAQAQSFASYHAEQEPAARLDIDKSEVCITHNDVSVNNR